MTIAYGQTESSPVITQTRPEDSLELRVSTVGRALPNVEVKIVDPATGELVFHELPPPTHDDVALVATRTATFGELKAEDLFILKVSTNQCCSWYDQVTGCV